VHGFDEHVRHDGGHLTDARAAGKEDSDDEAIASVMRAVREMTGG
jgi:hypothetical protein